MNYEAVSEHEASFPYSVELKAGDRVTIPDKEEDGWAWCINKEVVGAWIPKAYIDGKGHIGIMLVDYNSTELSVSIGEKLKSIKMEGGWMLCINSKGQKGWIPVDKAKKL